ncbi:sensor histidine kinase [Nonomuraea longicatena]|uniref:histidine kinase n=1 Tax=Nonomuraea longicatena TaxID=83682 RepID=A0ABP3ZY06_9ACTN
MRTENPKHATSGEYTGGRFRLANWRVRSRLVALILIPTIVGVLLAGVQLADAIGTSAEYRRLTQVAELVQRLGALSHELGEERALTAWYIADRRQRGRLGQLRTQRQQVNVAKTRVLDGTAAIDGAHAPRVRAEVETMRRWLIGLDGLRASILGESVPPRAAVRTFSTLIEILEKLQDELGQTEGDDDRLLGDVTALGAIQRVKEEISRQQVILLVALIERKLDYDDLSDFLGSWNAQQAEQAVFDQEADAATAAMYRKTVRGPAIDRADAMRQRALAQMREYKEIRDLDITAGPRREMAHWFDSTTLAVNSTREVEDKLAGAIVAKTRELSDAEQRNAIVSGSLIVVLLLLVLVITTRVAGSLVRPLRRLRAEALQVATNRLPETVRVLRESGEGAALPDTPSIGINTRDEIGEVARAFDEVHREAIRLAGDEAQLRANVNAMFVNLSRRSQTLVERQLQLIEGLEQGEEDEDRLANLFRLDHLATRMRRNSENLLVLAGQEAARKWSEPVPLVDIARASLSEVENYERVQIQIPSDIQIVGPAVTDAVHLLAELIENAISFSPRESRVSVTSAPADGGVLVTINDLGIGMTADELAEANWRLANPPVVDVSVSRRMGLFVVGRLALRHGIRVQLRMRETGGLSAVAVLPDLLIASTGGAVPQPRGQYDSFTSFDPAMLGAPPSSDTGFHSSPFAPNAARFDSPMDTQWPTDIPVPDTPWTEPAPAAPAAGNGWPSFAEPPVPSQPEAPQWTSLAEDPPRRAEEESGHWPSFGSERNWPSVSSGGPATGSSNGSAGNGASSLFTPFNTDYNSAEYSSLDLTGPMPVVDDSPIEQAGEDFLPIFSSVGSDWFRRPEPDQLQGMEPEPVPQPEPFEDWDPGPETSPQPALSRDGLPLPQREPFGLRDPQPEPLPQRDPAAGRPQPLPRRDAMPVDDFTPGAHTQTGLPQRSPGESGAGASWSSPADQGWQAAQAAAEPVQGGTTASGLPRRVPKANLVPGTASLAEPQVTSPAPPISPERLRNRLSSFQQGIRQGREDLKEKE